MKTIKAVRGMNDTLPESAHLWKQVEQACAKVLQEHCYTRIATPIVEKTDLFARSIGADTDIVGKEMYTFEDRNGDSLTLRPEGTASCVRAGVENGLFYNQQRRLWYAGPMFRHENPQKGRYRQFHQIGVESYGWGTPDMDAEVIALSANIWQTLNLKMPELQINSLGTIDDRKRYRADLIEYLSQFKDDLDHDSQRRLTTNPLRILDSKDQGTQALLVNAPSLLEYLDSGSKQDFEQLQEYLDALNIPYTVNSKLVRGLDYYNKTVFEWVYPELGAQATVCAGGRYDQMVEQLGGQATPAFGFALGVERLIQLIIDQEQETSAPKPKIYFMSDEGVARSKAITFANQLRQVGISVQLHCGAGSLKNQMKKADKSGAEFALILAEDELAKNAVAFKSLRQRVEQQNIPYKELIIFMQNAVN